MKNLVHFDWEKLDSQPTRGNHYEFKGDNVKFEHFGYRRYARNNLNYHLISNILHGSVGRNANKVIESIRQRIGKYIGKDSVYEWIMYDLKTPYTYVNHIPYVNDRYARTGPYFGLYVDRKGNIANRERPPYKTKVRYSARDHYEQIDAERKRNREENTEKILRQINPDIINNNVLFRYYQDLWRKRNQYIKTLKEQQSEYPPNTEYNYRLQQYIPVPAKQYANKVLLWKINGRDLERKKKEAKLELPIVTEHINLLKNKDYSQFFISDIYISSVVKACHHFEGRLNNVQSTGLI